MSITSQVRSDSRLPAGRRGYLYRNLWRIGQRVGRPRGIGALRWVLMLTSFFALTWGLVGPLIAHTTYEYRAEISRARTPVVDEQGSVRWGAGNISVDGRTVAWIALEPEDPDSDSPVPLPPGLQAMPEPGQAVISPALAEHLELLGVPDRFGEVVDVLPTTALASPGELIAYTRDPFPGTAQRERPLVSAFGVEADDPFDPFTGEVLYDRDVTEFWSLGVLLMLLPGLLAAVSAARVADMATRRRHIVLARLGAGRRHRMLIALPPALSAAAAALVLSVVGLGWLATGIRRIPLHGYLLDGAVVRGVLPLLLAATLGMTLFGMFLVVWLSAGRLGSLSAARLSVPSDRRSTVRTVILLVVLAGQPWLVGSGDGTIALIGTVLGAAAVALCLPGALADLVRWLSRWRSDRALRNRQAGSFVAWRMTGARPLALARLSGALGAMVILVAHAVVVIGMFLGPGLSTVQAANAVGEGVAEARLEGDAGIARAAVGVAEANELVPLRVDSNYFEGSAEIIATCSDLQALDLPCQAAPLNPGAGPRWLAPMLDWQALGTANVVVASPDEYEGDIENVALSVLIVSDPSGQEVDIELLNRDAYLDVEQSVIFSVPFGSALVGAADLTTKASWVYVFGAPGVMVLLLVGALSWAAVSIEEAQRVISNPVLSDQRQVINAIALVRIAFPVALGGIAGTVLASWLLAPHLRAHQMPPPWDFLILILIATIITSVAAGFAGKRLLSKPNT